MLDIKVATIRDLLPVYSITKVMNNPPTLQIIGENFSQATLVKINDVNAKEIFKVSNTKILAQIPDTEVSKTIKTVAVISDTVVAGRKSLLHFELSRFMQLTGIQKLVQYFVKVLLQSSGSDIFNPTAGGNLLRLIGQNDIQDGQDIRGVVVDSINSTKNYILSKQSKNPRIPAEERLQNILINGINIDPSTYSIVVDLLLINLANQKTTANVVF